MPKNRVGRPKKNIDWDLVDEYCFLHCTEAEIASFLRMTLDTFRLKIKEKYGINFHDFYRQRAHGGNISLRRKQWLNACNNDNATLQIWLGKQWLGQKDERRLDLSSDVPMPVRIIIEAKVPDDGIDIDSYTGSDNGDSSTTA